MSTRRDRTSGYYCCGGSGGRRSLSFNTSTADQDESKVTGASSASNSTVFVGEGIGASGALADAEVSIGDVFSSTICTDRAWKRANCNVDKREAIDGDRGANGQDEIVSDA